MLLSSVRVYLSGQSRMQSRRLRIMREHSLDSQLHSAMMLNPCHLSVALYKFTALADVSTGAAKLCTVVLHLWGACWKLSGL
mmetsp:Transcript_8247/g.9162  ORF Transcript_8247/g.9162 Transcript_8247/m.9162 type:complete len:82 (-) Transcript_8247:59-304(-)